VRVLLFSDLTGYSDRMHAINDPHGSRINLYFTIGLLADPGAISASPFGFAIVNLTFDAYIALEPAI